MKSSIAYGLSLALGCALAAGCGDDDEEPRATVSTGLPPNEMLSELNDDDAVQACVNTARAVNGVLPESQLERVSCIILALGTTRARGGEASEIPRCREIVDECLMGTVDGVAVPIETDILDEASCSEASATESLQSCDATVADYERCAGSLLTELRSQLNEFSCDLLRDPERADELLTGDVDVSQTPECEVLEEECPEFEFE